MRLDPVVKKENGFIAAAALVFNIVIQLVFICLQRWDYTVALGGVIGWALTVLNFFMMSRDVQYAVSMDDPEAAKLKMRNSYTWRTFLMIGVMAASLFLPWIHPIPVIVSAFCPRIAITVRQLWMHIRKKDDENAVPVSAAVAEEEEEDVPDEFEKMVGHFGKKTRVDYTQTKQAETPPSADGSDKEEGS